MHKLTHRRVIPITANIFLKNTVIAATLLKFFSNKGPYKAYVNDTVIPKSAILNTLITLENKASYPKLLVPKYFIKYVLATKEKKRVKIWPINPAKLFHIVYFVLLFI